MKLLQVDSGDLIEEMLCPCIGNSVFFTRRDLRIKIDVGSILLLCPTICYSDDQERDELESNHRRFPQRNVQI